MNKLLMIIGLVLLTSCSKDVVECECVKTTYRNDAYLSWKNNTQLTTPKTLLFKEFVDCQDEYNSELNLETGLYYVVKCN